MLMGLEFLLCFYQRWPAMHLIYVVLPIYLLALIINALNLTRNSSIDLLTFWRRTGPALIGYIVGLGKCFNFICMDTRMNILQVS